MKKTLFVYVLTIFLLTLLGIFGIAQLKSSTLSTNVFVQEATRFLRRNTENDNSNGSREVTFTSKFQSDYPPISLVQPQAHSKHLTTRIIRHSYINNDTCTESCCSKYSCHNHYQEVVPSCPICEECVTGNPLAFLPEAIQYIFMIVLLSFSGMFAGLTLGFLSLDKTGLEVLMESDDVHTAQYATKIYPIRLKGNLLLCTLLLGNTAANSLGSILIADLFGGLVGAIVSTIVILIFGEITPQAVCSRYALYIGSHAVPIVKVIIVLFYPIAKPLALTLDYALGDELATTYSSKEFIKLLQIHVEQNMLDHDTANTMTGALNYKNLPVRNAMTPLNNVFMVKTDDKLNFETIAKIFKAGYSRIPVYEVSPNNVVGLLFVKDLIFIDPEEETRVSDFIEIFGRGVHVVWPDDKLGDVLVELKRGRSHMALVRDVNQSDNNSDPFYEIQGIITLEDIIEEILGTMTGIYFFYFCHMYFI
jgi:metal transporter CNNM